jgi:hypothetical protein
MQIVPAEVGPGRYGFTFATQRGELCGRVTMGIEGPPDSRPRYDKEQAAKDQIEHQIRNRIEHRISAPSREFAKAGEQ